VKKLVEAQFPRLLPALDIIISNVLNNPDGHFATIRTNPWHYRDFMTIVGDAAHGFTPFYGMGTATAFGDCLELVRLLDENGADWAKIFPLYQEARKKNTDIIGELSHQAMKWFTRSTRADYGAIYEKVGTTLHTVFPKWYLPSMFYLVSHEPNRSAEYLIRHKKQDRLSKWMGLPLAAAGITAAVKVAEDISALIQPTK
jgi:kynurenine 3-monooxygenase